MADNSLGLELAPDDVKEQESPRNTPYVNPDRVSTGGPQRDKLSEDALAERMARIREQNEKIKQRRLDVEADKEAFRKTQDDERAKQVHSRKVQEDINKAREQAAKRKMDKAPSREWDSGKPGAIRRPTGGAEVKSEVAAVAEGTEGATVEPTVAESSGSGQWTRGGSPNAFRGRGRGRGRGRQT